MQNARLDRRLVALLALGSGIAIANIYCAQPLLAEIGQDFGVSGGTVGLIVTASQIGFAIGLAFVVPLGDLVERRALIVRLCLACSIALVATVLAPTFAVLAFALMFVGIATTVAQVIVPAAASLAADEERGRIVGIVMSGLLLGILVARTVSGLLAEAGGWQLPFAVNAGLMLVLVAAFQRLMPRHEPETDLEYRELLVSVFSIIRTEPVLRWRMVYGAMGMIVFTTLWTALTFLLAEQYGYSEATIGLFGLFGVVGAGAAQLAGQLVDRGHLHKATGAFMGLMLTGWVLLAFGAQSLALLIAGIIVVDFGLQGAHISNQNAIFALPGELRSRVTTAYMTNNFLWGAAASAAASFAYAHGGWGPVVVLGIGASAVGVVAWGAEQQRRRKTGDAAPARA